MSNYQSNHDTLEELEEEVLEQTSTQPAKSRTEMPSTLAEEVIPIQTPSVTTKCANEEETMSYSYSTYNDESVTTKSANEEETMLYSYSKYNDESNPRAHVHAFLTAWQANHLSQLP